MTDGPFRLLRELRRDLTPPPGRPAVVVYRSEADGGGRLLPPAEASRPGVSLVATVRDEAESIRAWFAALEGMTLRPDEVVIVDGGSTDGTAAVLEELACTSALSVRVLQAPGANIARGRNLAIAASVHPVIACTDAGCLVDPGWLAAITGPFADDATVDVVAGYYRLDDRTVTSRVLGAWFAPQASDVQPAGFLPSARSLAFRRSVWQAAGGFPEWLSLTAEDTLYALELRRVARTWAFVPEATVRWLLTPGFRRLFRQVRAYARGDGEAGLSAAEYCWRLRLAVEQGVTALVTGACTAMGVAFGQAWGELALVGVVWLGWRAHPPASLRRHGRGRGWWERTTTYVAAAAVNLVMTWAMAIGYVEGVRRRIRHPGRPQQPAPPAQPEPQPC